VRHATSGPNPGQVHTRVRPRGWQASARACSDVTLPAMAAAHRQPATIGARLRAPPRAQTRSVQCARRRIERGWGPARKKKFVRWVSRHSPLGRPIARQRTTRRASCRIRCARGRVLETSVQVRAAQVARGRGRSGRSDTGVLSARVREGVLHPLRSGEGASARICERASTGSSRTRVRSAAG
jgi:hypothetical protein